MTLLKGWGKKRTQLYRYLYLRGLFTIVVECFELESHWTEVIVMGVYDRPAGQGGS